MTLHGMPHIELVDDADHATVLANPHKGWYHHWFDNGVAKYPPRSDEDLLACPGLGLIYLRVPWCELEPERGSFRWELLDPIIERWAARGVRFALRLTCRETEYDFATPQWVAAAGARGARVTKDEWGRNPWQPDWGCPVFLEHLERFHAACGRHWGRHPALDHVDIGSYGTWGEGHTWPAETSAPTVPVMLEHLALHRRCWPGTMLVVTDEWLDWGRQRPECEILTAAVLAAGGTLRDDSFLVDHFVHHHRDTACIMRPWLFEAFWRLRPTILEHEHYGIVVKDGNWRGRDGAEFGAHLLRRALELTHCTWTGWHGNAQDWLRDNPALTAEVANRVGYWYFLESANVPECCRAGDGLNLELRWRNRGVAPAYRHYPLQVRLAGPGGHVELATHGSDNRRWLPDALDQVYNDSVTAAVPAGLAPGDYLLSVRLIAEDAGGLRPVLLALGARRREQEGWYAIGAVAITAT